MHPAFYYPSTNQSFKGVYAQERTESWMNWWIQLAVSGLVAVAAFTLLRDDIALALSLLAILASRPLTETNWFGRQQELMGHTVEIVVAGKDGFDEATYFEEEAARTWGNKADYGRLFEGWTYEEFKSAMRKRMGFASFVVKLQAMALRRLG